jgi:hypothetical protein
MTLTIKYPNGEIAYLYLKDGTELSYSGDCVVVKIERDHIWEMNAVSVLKPVTKDTKSLFHLLNAYDWVVVTSDNPNSVILSDKQNMETSKAAQEWLAKRGVVNFVVINNNEGVREIGFLCVSSFTQKDIIDFLDAFGQKSALASYGIECKGSIIPVSSVRVGKFPNNYTTVRTDDGLISFQAVYE